MSTKANQAAHVTAEVLGQGANNGAIEGFGKGTNGVDEGHGEGPNGAAEGYGEGPNGAAEGNATALEGQSCVWNCPRCSYPWSSILELESQEGICPSCSYDWHSNQELEALLLEMMTETTVIPGNRKLFPSGFH